MGLYPIIGYGNPILNKKCIDIVKNEIDINQLSEDMFKTMKNANGVGLASTQIGLNIRIFIIDITSLAENQEQSSKRVFINPIIEEEWGEKILYKEGCLSIPNIYEEISRYSNLRIRYFDTDWNEHIECFDGIIARVIQHEYDHIEGILFTERLSNLKKILIKSKLLNVSKGKYSTSYQMKYYKK